MEGVVEQVDEEVVTVQRLWMGWCIGVLLCSYTVLELIVVTYRTDMRVQLSWTHVV